MPEHTAHRFRNAVHPAALLSGLGTYLHALPLLTVSLLVELILVYLGNMFTTRVLAWQSAAQTFGLWPSRILHDWEVYRLLTFPWVHLGLGHLLLNLLAVVPLLCLLETAIGTLQTVYLLGILFTLLPGLGYVALSLGDSGLHETVVAGCSGWVFALVVWEAKRYGSRSFFGMFTVPAALFPVLILLLITMILPNASFWGHLTGMLAGYLYAYGLVGWLVPGAYHFERLEALRVMKWLRETRRYVPASADGLVWLPIYTSDDIPSNPFATRPAQPSNPSASAGAQRFPGQGARLGT